MNILVIRDEVDLQDCSKRFVDWQHFPYFQEQRDDKKFLPSHDLIFDFVIGEVPHQFEVYRDHSTTDSILSAR